MSTILIREMCQALGAVATLRKPFSHEELLGAVREALDDTAGDASA